MKVGNTFGQHDDDDDHGKGNNIHSFTMLGIQFETCDENTCFRGDKWSRLKWCDCDADCKKRGSCCWNKFLDDGFSKQDDEGNSIPR